MFFCLFLLPPCLFQPGNQKLSSATRCLWSWHTNSPSRRVACFTTTLGCGGSVWRALSAGVRVFLFMTGNFLVEVEVLQKIRLLSLIGRGTQFLELGKHKEALLDFHYGLQVSPGERLFCAAWRVHPWAPGPAPSAQCSSSAEKL